MCLLHININDVIQALLASTIQLRAITVIFMEGKSHLLISKSKLKKIHHSKAVNLRDPNVSPIVMTVEQEA
jgi:hypothetical protein